MELTGLKKAMYACNEKEKMEWLDMLNGVTVSQNLTHEEVCKRWATNSAVSKFNKKEILIDKLMLSAKKQIEKHYNNNLQKQIGKIESIENADPLVSVSISVEWKKSAMWGMNPHATVKCWTEKHYFSSEGSASGCGYDKLSSAVGDALNQIPAILKPLYIQAEKLEGNDKIYRAEIGYGCGYSILPYFEGGVGIECFQRIFEKLGYKWNNAGSGKMFDCYTIEKESRK